MYKNMSMKLNRPPKCQGWDDKEGAIPAVLNSIISKSDYNTMYCNIDDFYGSHTYLWLLEAGSYVPINLDIIMSIYNEEVKDGLVGFVNALLKYFPEDFDLPEDDE